MIESETRYFHVKETSSQAGAHSILPITVGLSLVCGSREDSELDVNIRERSKGFVVRRTILSYHFCAIRTRWYLPALDLVSREACP